MKLIRFMCVFAATALAASGEETWSSFQNGGNVSQNEDGKASLGEVRWKTSLNGYGQSSPVVWNDRICVTTVEGDQKDQYHVTAYSAADGMQLWKYSVRNPTPQENSTYVSRSAPTPVADTRGFTCFFEGGVVLALTHDGKLRWQKNLVEEFGGLGARHGLAASLENDATAVYVWVERSENPYVLKLNLDDGNVIWKSDGVGATSWASPRLVPVGDEHHLVLSAIGAIVGLDPANGKQLWRFEGISGNSTPTPMPLGNGRFLIGATTGRGETGGSRAPESNGVIRIQKKDEVWSADYEWHARRATSSFGSPIVHSGIAFFVNREGVVYGLDASDGSEKFAQRLKGSTWATPIGVGARVFFFGRDGRVDVLTLDGEKPSVSTWAGLPEPPKSAPAAEGGRPSFGGGPVLYAAAWCGDYVLLRRGDELYSVAVTR